MTQTAEEVNKLVNRCYQQSKDAGWWNDLKTGQPLELTNSLKAEKIALMHSELSEALEGMRKNTMDDKLPHRQQVEVELADAVIRIADFCGRLGLDLGGAIEEKLSYNRNREDHKIENRLKEDGKKF